MRCGDDGGPVKPDPEVLWSLAGELGVEPSRLLFVGDSVQDLQTARAAGMSFVAVVANPLPADHPDHPSPAAIAADAWVATISELV